MNPEHTYPLRWTVRSHVRFRCPIKAKLFRFLKPAGFTTDTNAAPHSQQARCYPIPRTSFRQGKSVGRVDTASVVPDHCADRQSPAAEPDLLHFVTVEFRLAQGIRQTGRIFRKDRFRDISSWLHKPRYCSTTFEHFNHLRVTVTPAQAH